MQIMSRSWQTDLALLEASGSTVEHHDDHLVVRTPDNPTYHWGNFLLLRRAPLPQEVDGWLTRFGATFPGSRHVAIGIDDPQGEAAALRPLAERGFEVDLSAVMTASHLAQPARPTGDAVLRPLASDRDWDQRVALGIACHGAERGPAYGDFARRRAAAERRLVDSGRGAWFGAFAGKRMVAGLGIVRAGAGLARYQEVETHPEHRRQGLASALVHAAGEHAVNALGSATLVIVADPSYHAYRLYERLGFRRTESQLQASLVR